MCAEIFVIEEMMSKIFVTIEFTAKWIIFLYKCIQETENSTILMSV